MNKRNLTDRQKAYIDANYKSVYASQIAVNIGTSYHCVIQYLDSMGWKQRPKRKLMKKKRMGVDGEGNEVELFNVELMKDQTWII